MNFTKIANSGTMYLLVIAALLLVVLAILYNLKKCYDHALARGVTKERLKKVILSSASFAIVPSLGVVVGLVALVAVIGIPYAWLRLSVLGSVMYELMASNMALSAMGLDAGSADGDAFGLMMWVMCAGITLPLVLNIFMIKPVHMGAMKLGEKDRRWGQLSNSTFLVALLIALVIPIFGSGVVELLTFATSAILGLIIMKLAKRPGLGWLGDFALAFSLIGAMAASVGFDALLK
ncbi:MAG: DUF5058 family protein [Anaerovoracaceae bacterium]